MADRFDGPAAEDPEASLERALMEQFLLSQRHSFSDLATLPEEERHRLFDAAAIYASRRLCEIGARAHFIDELHGRE